MIFLRIIFFYILFLVVMSSGGRGILRILRVVRAFRSLRRYFYLLLKKLFNPFSPRESEFFGKSGPAERVYGSERVNIEIIIEASLIYCTYWTKTLKLLMIS